MSTPAAKRQRLDDASRALSKPFKSPFRRTSHTEQGSVVQQDLSHFEGVTRVQHPEGGERTGQWNVEALASPTKAIQTSIIKPKHNAVVGESPISSASDLELASLLRTQRTLEGELRTVGEEVETLEQAVRIETSGEDVELENLVHKWKSASREAADEMFTSVRDRVNRMGGPSAWREMQRKKAEWSKGGFDEPEDKRAEVGEEDGDSGEKRDLYAEYDIDLEEREAMDSNQTLVEGKEDDAFTMDMMLQSLNIDLHVIGYDKEQQRWVD